MAENASETAIFGGTISKYSGFAGTIRNCTKSVKKTQTRRTTNDHLQRMRRKCGKTRRKQAENPCHYQAKSQKKYQKLYHNCLFWYHKRYHKGTIRAKYSGKSTCFPPYSAIFRHIFRHILRICEKSMCFWHFSAIFRHIPPYFRNILRICENVRVYGGIWRNSALSEQGSTRQGKKLSNRLTPCDRNAERHEKHDEYR